MTYIVVVGDSRIGKTKFMHLACSGACPLNIYQSLEPEIFCIRGCHGPEARIAVLPGAASKAVVQEHMAQADALVVIYNAVPHTARRWIVRCTGGRPTSLPIMICRHDNSNPPAEHRVADMLRHWPSAEHTHTSSSHAVGLTDCINRIIYRARAELGSPIVFH